MSEAPPEGLPEGLPAAGTQWGADPSPRGASASASAVRKNDPGGLPFARAFLLVASLASSGCARKSATTAADAAAPAAVRAASDDGGAPAPEDRAKNLDSGQSAETRGPTADGGAASEGGRPGFAGMYGCFATMIKQSPNRFTLRLTQAETTVAGESSIRIGPTTQSIELRCRVSGDTCSGQIHRFTSTNGGQRKPTAQGRVTMRIAEGGLEYWLAYSEYPERPPGFVPTGARGFCSRR